MIKELDEVFHFHRNDLKPFEFILGMFGIDDDKQFFMDWFEHYEGIRPEYVDF